MTDLDQPAVRAYAARSGQSEEEYVQQMGKLLTPEVAGVAEEESGLAADLNNTSVQIGTALGVAILSTVAASQAAGASPVAGFQSGFAAAVVSPTLGVLVALLLLGRRPRKSAMATTTPATESA